MQIRNLGGSGLRVSAVGLGCNNFWPAHRPRNLAQGDPQGDRPWHHAVRYRGYLCRHRRLRDGARRGARRPAQGHRAGDEIFQADEQRRHPAGRVAALHHVRRRGQPEAAEDRLYRSLPAARLRFATPIEETLRALDDLVRQGKVRYIGNSNFPAWRIAEAEHVARAINVNRFVSCQDVEYSLVVRDIEKDLLPAARHYKISDCCRSSRSPADCSPANTGAAPRRRRNTRFGKAPALRDRYVTPRNEDLVEKLRGLRAGARPHHARTGVLMAGVAAAGGKRHRRRHADRADRAERQGDRLGARRGRACGDRCDDEIASSLRHGPSSNRAARILCE